MDDKRPLIIGELNPFGGDDYYALYPAPDGCSGHRLCTLVLGMDQDDYLEAFDRANLCRGKWSVKAARLRLPEFRGRYCILLGSKVCTAFDVPFEPFAAQFPSTEDGGGGLLVFPHPSGLCRLWQERGAFLRAREALAKFVPGVAPLLGRAVRSGV